MDIICASGPNPEELALIAYALSHPIAPPAFCTDAPLKDDVLGNNTGRSTSPIENHTTKSNDATSRTPSTAGGRSAADLLALLPATLSSLSAEEQQMFASKVIQIFHERKILPTVLPAMNNKPGLFSGTFPAMSVAQPSTASVSPAPKRRGRPPKTATLENSTSASSAALRAPAASVVPKKPASLSSGSQSASAAESAKKIAPNDKKAAKDLLYSTESELIDVNLRHVFSFEVFSQFSAEEKNRLLELLPLCDSSDRAAIQRLFTASHQPFQHALQHLKDLLAQGRFERGFGQWQQSPEAVAAQIRAKQAQPAPWKQHHFEEYWGQKWAPDARAAIAFDPYATMKRYQFVDTPEEIEGNALLLTQAESRVEKREAKKHCEKRNVELLSSVTAQRGRKDATLAAVDAASSTQNVPSDTAKPAAEDADVALYRDEEEEDDSSHQPQQTQQSRKQEKSSNGTSGAKPAAKDTNTAKPTPKDTASKQATTAVTTGALSKKRGRPPKRKQSDAAPGSASTTTFVPEELPAPIPSRPAPSPPSAAPSQTKGSSSPAQPKEVPSVAPPAVAGTKTFTFYTPNKFKRPRGRPRKQNSLPEPAAVHDTAQYLASIEKLLQAAGKPMHLTELLTIGLQLQYFPSTAMGTLAKLLNVEQANPESRFVSGSKSVYGLRAAQYPPGAFESVAAAHPDNVDDEEDDNEDNSSDNADSALVEKSTAVK